MSSGGSGEFVGEGFAAEGFPLGFELGDFLGERLALLEDLRRVIEVAEGVAIEGGGEISLGIFLEESGVGEGRAAAGSDAESGVADGELGGVGESVGLAGGEGLAVEGDRFIGGNELDTGGHGVEAGGGLGGEAIELAEGVEVFFGERGELGEGVVVGGDFLAELICFLGAFGEALVIGGFFEGGDGGGGEVVLEAG